MKDITNMTFGEALQYVRKRTKGCSSRSLLSVRARIESWAISAIEKGNMLPSKGQLNAICDVLGSEELRKKGLADIEYKRTHPDVKICYSDRTQCWRCGEKMCSVYGLIDGSPIPPDMFNEAMRRISREKGVILEDRQSGVTGETHLVNVCPHCGAFIGEFYMHDLWYEETEVIQIEDVADFIISEEVSEG